VFAEVAVGIGVLEAVGVFVEVGAGGSVLVGVFVPVGVLVEVTVGIGVLDAVGVFVEVDVGGSVLIGVFVSNGNGVFIADEVDVAVDVPVGVWVASGVEDEVGVVGVNVAGGVLPGGRVPVAVSVAPAEGLSVRVGWGVPVDIADSVGVISSVFVAVGADVFVADGVLVSVFPPGAEFLGTLVGFGVAEGEVGQLIGLSVGLAVGDCIGLAPTGLVGVTPDGLDEIGVYAGGIGLLITGEVGVNKLGGTAKFGVMVGTGVSKPYAMAVDRDAISSAAGS